MNKDILEGNWEIIKGKLKKQWGMLTDDELKEIEGNREVLVGMLERKYGYTKDEIQEKLDNL